jgi:hypothetical protein
VEDKTRPAAVHKFRGARAEKITVRTRVTRRSLPAMKDGEVAAIRRKESQEVGGNWGESSGIEEKGKKL